MPSIVFDLDGTLLDTLADLRAAVNYALRFAGLPERSPEEIRRAVGNGVRALVERSIPGGASNPAFPEVFQTFRLRYSAHSLDETRPYAGVTDLLAALHDRGFRMAIVSNKTHEAVLALVAEFFAPWISVAVGERDGLRKKPAPDMVFEALHRLGNPPDAVYVGDSDVDFATAKAAGLPCLSVLWGFRTREELLACGATTFVETPADLLAALTQRA